MSTVVGVGLVAASLTIAQGRVGGAGNDSVRMAAATGQHADHGTQSSGRQVADLRATLEKLLGHHATLAIRMMRAELAGSPDFLESAEAALRTNTADLGAVVRAVGGASAGGTFERLWADHGLALFKYAHGASTGNAALTKRAAAQLRRYEARFGEFAESASGGELRATGVAGALRTHVDLLLRQTDAYAAGDYVEAYTLQRQAYAHMFPLGRTLASGFAGRPPGELPVAADDPAQELRSALGMLLGEHVELVVDSTRAGVTGAPEFRQAAAAMNGNTRDLTAAIRTLFGRTSARQFSDIWADHIDLFVRYTAAVAEDDGPAARKARRRLRPFQARLIAYLGRATGSRNGVKAVAAEIRMHEDLLLRQIDEYAAEEYLAAHRISYRAYQDMFSTSTSLTALLEEKLAAVLPPGGVQTGGGGTARRRVD